jgi:nucleotide-binding universal stress UspA family protein
MSGILVGIDGSDHAMRALEWAINEASLRHTPLTVLTVHQVVTGYLGGSVLDPKDSDRTAQAREVAQDETDRLLEKSDPKSQPPSVTVKAVTGVPAEELLNAAAVADMVVVGSRGAGGFKRLLMGSVSTQVTLHAHCPVVVIPTENA